VAGMRYAVSTRRKPSIASTTSRSLASRRMSSAGVSLRVALMDDWSHPVTIGDFSQKSIDQSVAAREGRPSTRRKRCWLSRTLAE
jgi:hypothetical protein